MNLNVNPIKKIIFSYINYDDTKLYPYASIIWNDEKWVVEKDTPNNSITELITTGISYNGEIYIDNNYELYKAIENIRAMYLSTRMININTYNKYKTFFTNNPLMVDNNGILINFKG